MDTLKYAFRGIEQNADWINRVILIVQQESQIPPWLNRKHKKLKIIYHKDFIPRRFLPTFNSNVIELFTHRIKGLSENFLIANDDMIIVGKVSPEDFFRDGIPVDCSDSYTEDYKLEGTGIFKYIKYNTLKLACELVGRSPVYFRNFHLIMPHSKQIWQEVWAKAGEKILHSISNSPKRTRLNVNHWLFRYYGLLTKRRVINPEMNRQGYIDLEDSTNFVRLNYLLKRSNVVCINDGVKSNTKVIDEMKAVLEKHLSKKSSFEV